MKSVIAKQRASDNIPEAAFIVCFPEMPNPAPLDVYVATRAD